MWSNDMKYKYMFMFPLNNLACKQLKTAILHQTDKYKIRMLYLDQAQEVVW